MSACDLFSFLTLHALVLPLPPQSDAAEVQMRHSPLAGDASAPCRREIRLLESTARTGPVTAAGNKPEASSIELLISTAAARMAGWGIRNRKCRHETGLTRGKAELKSSTAPLPSPGPGYPQRSQAPSLASLAGLIYTQSLALQSPSPQSNKKQNPKGQGEAPIGTHQWLLPSSGPRWASPPRPGPPQGPPCSRFRSGPPPRLLPPRASPSGRAPRASRASSLSARLTPPMQGPAARRGWARGTAAARRRPPRAARGAAPTLLQRAAT